MPVWHGLFLTFWNLDRIQNVVFYTQSNFQTPGMNMILSELDGDILSNEKLKNTITTMSNRIKQLRNWKNLFRLIEKRNTSVRKLNYTTTWNKINEP